jgi:hypothetical protein
LSITVKIITYTLEYGVVACDHCVLPCRVARDATNLDNKLIA